MLSNVVATFCFTVQWRDLLVNAQSTAFGAGIAQWLERRTRD